MLFIDKRVIKKTMKIKFYIFILAPILITIFAVFATSQADIVVNNFYSTHNHEVLQDDVTEVLIEAFGSITLPPEMEIQSGNYKTLTDKLKEILGIESESVVFQQKGLNDFNKDGFSTYARIMIKTITSSPGTYPDLKKNKLSRKDLKDIEKELKDEIENSLSPMNIFITKWYPVATEDIDNFTSVKVRYDRQLGDNPEVEVEQYMIFNNDRIHIMTFSNRIEDRNEWTSVFDDVKLSILINRK